MKICNECDRKFPDGIVQLMITTRGNTYCCPICALDIRNKIHGLNDNKFQGQEANRLLRLARKYVAKEPNNG